MSKLKLLVKKYLQSLVDTNIFFHVHYNAYVYFLLFSENKYQAATLQNLSGKNSLLLFVMLENLILTVSFLLNQQISISLGRETKQK